MANWIVVIVGEARQVRGGCLRTRRGDATRREEGRGEGKSKVGYNDEKIQRAKGEVKRNVKRRKGRLKPAERTRKNGSLAVRWRGEAGREWKGPSGGGGKGEEGGAG